MANPVSPLQSERQEQPFAKYAMTCGLRKTLHNDGKLERSHGGIAITDSENSSRPTGTVRCMHACERWPAPTPCAERPPWLWVLLQSKPHACELRETKMLLWFSTPKERIYIDIYLHIYVHLYIREIEILIQLAFHVDVDVGRWGRGCSVVGGGGV